MRTNLSISNFNDVRKIVSVFFIFIGLALLLISNSDHLMEKIIAGRSALNNSFGIHQFPGEDLVSISYLDNVKRFQDKDEFIFNKPVDDTGSRNIDLYIYGDSYLMEIPDTAFSSINSYHYCRRSYQDMNYSLNPHKKNILIIEIAERFARVEFELQETMRHFKKKQPEVSSLRLSGPSVIYAKFPDLDIFSPDVNRNLEFNLYGYRFWDQVKFAKASLTYYLFKRAVGDAVVSDDGNRLFLKETMAENDRASSYYPFEQKEIQKMFFNLNATCAYYKADGFDEVYLSIIPNPVTILQPLHYNGLIPQLQQPDSLKCMHIIDMYDPFSKDPDPGRLFKTGDTHWSNNGIQLWLKTVNAELKKQNLQAVSKRNSSGYGLSNLKKDTANHQ
jgi:hypothetical protein